MEINILEIGFKINFMDKESFTKGKNWSLKAITQMESRMAQALTMDKTISSTLGITQRANPQAEEKYTARNK